MTQGTSDSQTGCFIVGIDAGGTSVRGVLVDRTTDQAIGEAETAASPDGGPDALAGLIAMLMQGLVDTGEVAGVTAGITKFTRTGVREQWEGALATRFPRAVCTVVPDYVIAFHGAIPDGVGIAVIAGTGSVVYGADATGETVRVGGRGWEYGDEGSGAHLTSEAIRRTLRALDGMDEPTPLTRVICDLLGTNDPATLAENARQHAVTEGRGFLVPLALERARSGDQEAVNLFVGAAGWLAAQVRAAHRRLFFPADAPVHVATIGGMWTAEELLQVPFTRVLERWIPKILVMSPVESPVRGALRLAAKDARDARIDKGQEAPYT